MCVWIWLNKSRRDAVRTPLRGHCGAPAGAALGWSAAGHRLTIAGVAADEAPKRLRWAPERRRWGVERPPLNPHRAHTQLRASAAIFRQGRHQ